MSEPNPFQTPEAQSVPSALDDTDDPYAIGLQLKFDSTRKLLLGISILYLVQGGLALATTSGAEAVAALIFSVFLATIHFGIWLWAKRSPFAAVVTAFTIFVLILALAALANPASLLSVVNIVIFIALLRGLKLANEIRSYDRSRAGIT